MTQFSAKKSLGQHFLRSAKVLEQIITVGRLGKNDVVLEVGPGQGILTEKLLALAGRVIAVEKDGRLISFLENKFQKEISAGKLALIHNDILNFNPSDYKLKAGGYKLMANLPYYITGRFLRRFLTAEQKPSLLVLMLQKEVAERIIAKNRKETVLSLSVKLFGRPSYLATVKKDNFKPRPKVDSAIIIIDDIGRPLPPAAEKLFFKIVRAGFGRKRKKLLGNLKELAGRERLEKLFAECAISPTARAEDLSPAKWLCLTAELSGGPGQEVDTTNWSREK